jgi:hypothetical protein
MNHDKDHDIGVSRIVIIDNRSCEKFFSNIEEQLLQREVIDPYESGVLQVMGVVDKSKLPKQPHVITCGRCWLETDLHQIEEKGQEKYDEVLKLIEENVEKFKPVQDYINTHNLFLQLEVVINRDKGHVIHLFINDIMKVLDITNLGRKQFINY